MIRPEGWVSLTDLALESRKAFCLDNQSIPRMTSVSEDLRAISEARNTKPLSGPEVRVCKSRYNTVIWRAENRTHLSKQTRPSIETFSESIEHEGHPIQAV